MKIALFERGRWTSLLALSLLCALLVGAPVGALAADWRRLCEFGTPVEVEEVLRTSFCPAAAARCTSPPSTPGPRRSSGCC